MAKMPRLDVKIRVEVDRGPSDGIQAIIDEWVPRLRLGDWSVRYSPLEPEPTHRSSVDMFQTIRYAAIRLRSDTPPSQVVRQVVHELLHIRFVGMEEAYNLAKGHTPKAFDDSADVLWANGCEAAIEALSDIILGTGRGDWGPSGEIWSSAFPVPES